jgi:transcriptional regulator with XRE-family HTH domain
MDVRRDLSRNMKALRQAKGISQEELAHRADLDRTYVSALERCIYAASIDVVARIAAVLEVQPDELLRAKSTKKGEGNG